ncbi:unnamed protein product [Linum trigynum]|uniref:Uncharacterized protein n=1 Tax=Linum trigynum TaxID=586398 RepID=A0AAV2DQ84_9ROSI
MTVPLPCPVKRIYLSPTSKPWNQGQIVRLQICREGGLVSHRRAVQRVEGGEERGNRVSFVGARFVGSEMLYLSSLSGFSDVKSVVASSRKEVLEEAVL